MRTCVLRIREKSNRVLGVDPKMLLGQRREEIACIDDVAEQGKWAVHLQVLTNMHLSETLTTMSVAIWVWFSISGVPVFDSDGKFLGYRGTGANISARKQFEIDLIEARKTAESATSQKVVSWPR